MNYNKLLLIFILTTILCGLPALVQAETEPNDSIDTANPISIGLNNAEVGATLTADDEDYYKFTAVAGRTYVIETFNIQGTANDATGLWLYDSTGTLITDDQYSSEGTGNADARIVYTFISGGEYFIRVRSYREPNIGFQDWTGSYSLRVLAKYDEPGAGWEANNDNEPNDVRALANEIGIGVEQAQTHQLFDNTNLVSDRPDYDFYRFTAEAGHTYVIETFNIQGTADDATGLWLYDSTGTLITDDQYSSDGTGNADARIVYTFISDGEYFIRVRSYRDQFGNFTNWRGTYSLRVLAKYDEPGAGWEVDNDNEPNDVMALANKIEVGVDEAQTHQLFDNTNLITDRPDYDYYRFTAEADRTYVIETFNVQTADDATGLWLYDSTGTLITDDQYSNGTDTADAQIVYSFIADGEYFIRVRSYREINIGFQDWTGTYSVRVCENSCLRSIFLPIVLK